VSTSFSSAGSNGGAVGVVLSGGPQGLALAAARAALAGREAWLVGGYVRDRLLGRETTDIDLVVAEDPGGAARAIARAAGRAACFALSPEYGSWRVVAHSEGWQIDVEPLRADTIERDLALRDFTANALAQPLVGGEMIDPTGGLEDLNRRRLRLAGAGAFAADPLRVLRLVRVAVELGMYPEQQTLASAGEHAPALRTVSAERVFMELRRIVAAREARRGLEMASEVGALAAVLPELEALRGVGQSRFHHTDVFEHTLETLDWTIALDLELDPREPEHRPELAPVLDGHRAQVAALLREPLADEMSRGEALRWGALLHDAAKPLTRRTFAGAAVGFPEHDVRGAQLAREVLTRLRTSERLRAHVASLARHHLRLGFLVHEPQPLARRTVFAYLRACEPVEVDVTLLSVADRLATRGARAERSIEAHLRLAAALLPDALRWRADGPPQPPLRGDELARELGIARGPRLGLLLEELRAASYAGELSTREQAIAYAHTLLASL
jgi:putative nucleotidyltransferase with HDIG domain